MQPLQERINDLENSKLQLEEEVSVSSLFDMFSLDIFRNISKTGLHAVTSWYNEVVVFNKLIVILKDLFVIYRHKNFLNSPG